MKLDDLKKPFPAELISWRVGATDKKKQERIQKNKDAKATCGIALAYIDARDVMARLDDVCGVGNWQTVHPHANGKTSCRIGIKIGDEWIWKENGAGDSAMDAEKGAFSDSFKRAAVLWGIGRYLYDVPNIWVDLDNWGKIKNPNDKRLKDALAAAEKGIRLPDEPEPKPPELTDDQKWCKDECAKIVKMENPEELDKWQKSNIERLSKLNDVDRKKMDDFLAKQFSRLSPIAEAAE